MAALFVVCVVTIEWSHVLDLVDFDVSIHVSHHILM